MKRLITLIILTAICIIGCNYKITPTCKYCNDSQKNITDSVTYNIYICKEINKHDYDFSNQTTYYNLYKLDHQGQLLKITTGNAAQLTEFLTRNYPFILCNCPEEIQRLCFLFCEHAYLIEKTQIMPNSVLLIQKRLEKPTSYYLNGIKLSKANVEHAITEMSHPTILLIDIEVAPFNGMINSHQSLSEVLENHLNSTTLSVLNDLYKKKQLIYSETTDGTNLYIYYK